MSQGFDVAIVGATGAVGETLLAVLEERQFPVRRLYAITSSRSAGKEIQFHGSPVVCEDIDTFDFSKVQLAFFSAGKACSEAHARRAVEAGVTVIDNTSAFRYDDNIPLVVSEVNGDGLSDIALPALIANPNCSTMQLCVALKPIHDHYGIKRVNVSTYQAVSGAGRQAMDELADQTRQLLGGFSVEPSVFTHQIAFNVLPHIDTMQDNGYTREEMKMVWETRKIFNDDSIEVNPTAVRVPVFYGHSEAVHVETKEPFDFDELCKHLDEAEGMVTMPNRDEFITPIAATDRDEVFVGRVRRDLTNPKALNMWVVSDNIRKGAATNAVQIAELLPLVQPTEITLVQPAEVNVMPGDPGLPN